MKRFIVLLIFLISSFSFSFSQIVNVESLQRISDTSKRSGATNLDISLIKNTQSRFKITNKFRLQYITERNFYLFINDLKLEQIEDNSFVNKGILH